MKRKGLIVLLTLLATGYYGYRYLPAQYNPLAPLRLEDPPGFISHYKLRRLTPAACASLLEEVRRACQSFSFRDARSAFLFLSISRCIQRISLRNCLPWRHYLTESTKLIACASLVHRRIKEIAKLVANCRKINEYV